MFNIIKLNYSFDALEPHIDTMTMDVHYNKHYYTYTNNLNKSIEGTILEKKKIEYILTKCIFDPFIRNNAGGYFNHNLFWKIINPNKKIDINKTILYKYIKKYFNSFLKFKEEFNNLSLNHFGSGWSWLCYDKKDKILNILTTPNQDNPLMIELGFTKNYIPLLCLDLWEHAYYLKYQNRRIDYINAFWNVVNWRVIEDILVCNL